MTRPPSPTCDRSFLLDDLNAAQRQAVTEGAGPLLVVAGAGTGKTRVLTRRIAWWIAGGLPARAVLALTFTNKAAGVLKARLGDLPRAREVWAGTFHGFGAWMLRARGDAIGIEPGFTILDREDQRRLVRDVLLELDLPHGARLTPAEAVDMIGHVKGGGGGPPPVDLVTLGIKDAFDRVLEAYRDRLRRSHLLDFDDLLLEPLRLLDAAPEVAEHFRRRFAHVFVDEYQDTNLVQAALLRALLGPQRNLTAVGDPDQSIYRWRGAAVRNILEFEQDFPGARVVVLEQNYRSSARILEAAEHVIAKNEGRHAKRLFTERPPGELVTEIVCRDGADEAQAVVEQIGLWRREGYAYGDIAVFYRVNALSRALELALRAAEVPYVVVAGVEFFQRREVKDLLAYARLVENPDDDAAFLRVANVPKRGVGATSLAKIRRAAQASRLSCVGALREGVPGVSKPALRGLTALLDVVDRVRRRPRAPVGPLLRELAERSGYLAWVEAEAERDDFVRGRVENVEELVAFANELDRGDASADLRSFLERTALVADQDALEEDHGRVTLMSVHAAKGLEYPCVLVAGVEDELFPHARGSVDRSGLEEERRLFYVALTRARERLALSWGVQRMTFRGVERRLRSPFLDDVPEELLCRRGRDPYGLGHDAEAWPGHVQELEAHDTERTANEVGLGFALGERVLHPYFGVGTLCDVRGTGAEARVTVEFVAHGTKQLLLRHARLERAP